MVIRESIESFITVSRCDSFIIVLLGVSDEYTDWGVMKKNYYVDCLIRGSLVENLYLDL